MWEIHYSRILNSENRAELWPLYLAYDTEIRKRTTQLPIDPSAFSIGIWNDLENRFSHKTVLSMVQNDIRQITEHFSSNNSPNPPSYTPRNQFQPPSFRNQQITLSDNPRTGRCIFCGDRSRSHPSNACIALCYSKVSHAILQNKNPMARGPTGRGNDIVSLGTAHLVALKPLVAKETMRVPFAAPQDTTLKSAVPPPNILTVNTPFIPDEWEKLLNAISPFNKFSDVPNSFGFGFDMGVHTPPQYTYTPPNHNSALSYPKHVLSHIHKELSLRRYSGPF